MNIGSTVGVGGKRRWWWGNEGEGEGSAAVIHFFFFWHYISFSDMALYIICLTRRFSCMMPRYMLYLYKCACAVP